MISIQGDWQCSCSSVNCGVGEGHFGLSPREIFCLWKLRSKRANAANFLIPLDLKCVATDLAIEMRDFARAMAFRFGPHADQFGSDE
jgi:hypothetical protein